MLKTTMKVREMGRMLGLKKVESYWLVHKGWFKTFQVNGKLRVDIESFEQWYNTQYRYQKVDGPPPSCGLMTVRQMGRMLGLPDSTAYSLTQKGLFRSERREGVWLVFRDSFEEWYAGQEKYKKTCKQSSVEKRNDADALKRQEAEERQREEELAEMREREMEELIRRRFEALGKERGDR